MIKMMFLLTQGKEMWHNEMESKGEIKKNHKAWNFCIKNIVKAVDR